MTITFSSDSTEMTETIGAELSSSLDKAHIRRMMIALDGEMGVGKTAFTRGFCRALGIHAVKSPTYTVVNEYRDGTLPVFHFDMYRLSDEDDLLSVGYEEYLAHDGYLLAEWSERAGGLLPDERITVTISRTDTETGRKIDIEVPTPLADRLHFHAKE